MTVWRQGRGEETRPRTARNLVEDVEDADLVAPVSRGAVPTAAFRARLRGDLLAAHQQRLRARTPLPEARRQRLPSVALALVALACGLVGPRLVARGGPGAGPLLRMAALPPGELAAVAVHSASGHVFVANRGAWDTGGTTMRVRSTVSMLDGQTGRILRTVIIRGDQSASEVLVNQRGNRVFVTARGNQDGINTGSLIMLDAHTGAILRTIALGTLQYLALDEPAHHLFVGDHQESKVTMVDALSGQILRIIPLPDGFGFGSMAVDEQTGRGYICPPGYARMTLLPILNTRTGTLIGVLHMRAAIAACAGDAAHERVVVATARREPAGRDDGSWSDVAVSVLDARTGALLRTTLLARGKTAAVWISADQGTGHVFVGYPGWSATTSSANPGGAVAMLDSHSGVLLRTRALQNSWSAIADARGGRLYVATSGPCAIAVLDTRTSAPLHTVALPPGACADHLALDERRHRAVVLLADHGTGTTPLGYGRLALLDLTAVH